MSPHLRTTSPARSVRPAPPGSSAGFTLIEILVVITILGLLLTVGAMSYSKFLGEGGVAETKSRIAQLGSLLSAYKNSRHYGDYPSGRLADHGVKQSNGLYEGSEALYVAFHHKDYDGASPESSWLSAETPNLDGDRTNAQGLLSVPSDQLHEFVDSWDNPIVYLRYDMYDQEWEYEFVNQDTLESEVVRVRAAKDERTGSYHGRTSYQLMSAGPDGVFGNEDDITSFD